MAVLALAAGCQQKMATQPAPRPYETNKLFPHDQSARPLEAGVVHRNQAVAGDPMATWLTPAGMNPKVSAAWRAAVDPSGTTQPTAGAPTSVENFVTDYPFEITATDLTRGQSLFNANCALCHGAGGWGNGKIPERGVLKPPSYHVDPAGKQTDGAYFVGDHQTELPLGYSRGFDRYGIKVPLTDVPVGYIYQVITWGYGGMGSHATQLPIIEDRWRVIAYVRALQYSQHVPAGELTQKQRDEANDPHPKAAQAGKVGGNAAGPVTGRQH